MTARSATVPALAVATVNLRYRPLGDVLAAEVRVPGRHRRREEPLDADVTLVWAEREDGTTVLAGLQILRASRCARRLVEAVPAPLADAAVALVERGERGLATVDSVARRARAVIDATVALPVDALALRAHPVTDEPRPANATEVADAFRALARSVRDAHLVSDVTDPVASAVLAAALDELALGVASGRPAPGAAAAVLTAVRGRIPLTTAERIDLRSVVVATNDVDGWADAPRRLRHLSAAVAPWVVEGV